MPEGDNTPVLVFGGLALAGAGAWWLWNSKRQAGNGGGGGNGGGVPPPPGGGLTLAQTPVFNAVATTNSGAVLAGPGETLPVGDALQIATVVGLQVKNTSQSPLWLGTNQRLWRRVNFLPDDTWVEANPQGITKVETTVRILNPAVTPESPLSISAGQTIPLGLGIRMQGPGAGFDERLFWVATGDVEFGYNIELLELSSQLATTGRRIAFKEWAPAFKADVPLFGARHSTKGVRRVTGRAKVNQRRG